MYNSVRKSDLATLAAALEAQRTRSLDVVASAQSLTVRHGSLVLDGLDPVITTDGVTSANGVYTPTEVGDEGIADKLRIPSAYLRRMRSDALDLYDMNVNGWLARDNRQFLVRLLRGDSEPETGGVMRAFLSDSYRTIDNFDVLLATLQGMRDAGVSDPQIKADLTDRRMYVRVVVPEIKAYAYDLLADYRSPFNGKRGDESPLVFAGFVVSNSDTGNGAFNITPRLEAEVCDNGLTISADAARKVHLGGKLDAGIVKVSDATQRANLDLIKSQTADAVRTFLDVDYVRAKVRELEKAAGVPVSDPQKTIANVSKQLGFSKEQQTDILSHFITGGQLTAGGVMQAITSAAQLQSNGDEQWDMEVAALPAMALAAKSN